MSEDSLTFASHSHVFLGQDHAASERKTWSVVALCAAMMAAEIVGGWLFGSIALIADGLHMSTHAGALLLAALAYGFARRYADDPRFAFGAGKFGDLAGFASALILAMIALLIACEGVTRLFAPGQIHFGEAIPIAVLGLGVNILSAWLLSGADHHAHVHAHGHVAGRRIATARDSVLLEIVEDGVLPRFRIKSETGTPLGPEEASVETRRPDGRRQTFAFAAREGYLVSVDVVPEPHEFVADLKIAGRSHEIAFEEHEHARGRAARDNNLRAAFLHVLGDAAVSAMVIAGLVLAWAFGWLWMDALAGLIGAAVIASWALSLIRDAGAVLLDMTPDRRMADNMRRAIETDGDRIFDLHLWRLAPGHLGAIVSVLTRTGRDEADYREKLRRFASLSHLTIEVRRAA